mmetsp:Transcript_63478/g.137443  ORF Transcript_63478/g.137443 Transcript_63478/m.137443 type:complete len:111 (-) Transcript_63478:82-414(-)|eukprot:CAMPEP_0116907110 /NCGR_PEP_ID=MMETSP0467-20121206/12912_1 /TAXON_ID=283647 /ORGANISM="Mesodinium pulex, Strain SPMC105" /LENGTH=110 /DNA_ID=CAMNT_0004582069 /DNA_START=80 /DNA_END=412 /DNA_ORIENTATION=+
MKLKIDHPGAGNVTRKAVQARLASIMRCKDEQIIVMNLACQFGGGVTNGYALVYNDLNDLKKFSLNHFLVRNKIVEATKKKARKTIKTDKNKRNKYLGLAKDKGPKKKNN